LKLLAPTSNAAKPNRAKTPFINRIGLKIGKSSRSKGTGDDPVGSGLLIFDLRQKHSSGDLGTGHFSKISLRDV
ncbi:MAG TPA: hypothetical protein VFC26_15605, partial [Verrucomicrobiae bacterium]|nr:hypothetical protein [Verrucomicrobiae bacterium]